jgi:hypothetical protein
MTAPYAVCLRARKLIRFISLYTITRHIVSADHRFTFDRVYDQSVPQTVVYEETARAGVLSTLQGYNATVFAYGQTGSGKVSVRTLN